MEEQMLFENLDEKLEDELAVITTTWLSINFELPIGEAEGTPETRAKTSIVSSPQVCCPILPISSTFFDTKPGKKVSPKKTIPEKPAVLISKSTDQEEEEEEFLTSAVLRSSKRKRLIFDSDEEEATTDPAEKVPQSRTSPRKSAHRDQKTTPKATKKILAADSETDSPTPKPARGRRPRSGAAATETEREAPIAPLSRESRTTTCSPKKPQASKPKSPVKTNRRRRQVLKTFMDDDGYMVTEKVWESTSENDEEPDEPIRAVHLAVDAKPCVSPSKHDTDARLTGTPTMGSTVSTIRTILTNGDVRGEMAQWLEHEFTDWKAWATWQLTSPRASVCWHSSWAREGATAERFFVTCVILLLLKTIVSLTTIEGRKVFFCYKELSG
ncbi:hypothetical protein CSKR_107251 [Clonorchis sinensis]|uniref:Uncharacterized protein n=1 Tax=Clonorchis sinensis TaxID=79923 RepID=A0A3R7FRX1_CLOSI|nr:hypothetical protein CSKR_107251 [Clonorchis sinensis]